MDIAEINEKIDALKAKIATYPRGTIGKKTVGNKCYYYNRYRSHGKRLEIYIKVKEVDEFRARIYERRELEKQLNELKALLPPPPEKPKRTRKAK